MKKKIQNVKRKKQKNTQQLEEKYKDNKKKILMIQKQKEIRKFKTKRKKN